MAQQTAVEWLIEQLEGDDSKIARIIGLKEYNSITKQAKQMEEEQHKETFKQSRQAKIFEKDMPPVWQSWEQYYNETYGKE